MSEENCHEISEREFWLLSALCSGGEAADIIFKHVCPYWFSHPDARDISECILQGLSRGISTNDALAVIGPLVKGRARSVLMSVEGNVIKNQSVKHIEESCRMLRNDWADRALSDLKLEIGKPNITETLVVAIIAEQGRLRRLKDYPIGNKYN